MAFSGVLLAHSWKGQDPKGWWMSEKLDGVRAYWDGHRLYTRNKKIIHAPDWFLAQFPDFALDGELFTARGQFQEIVSIVRKHTPVDREWRKIKFLAFDAPDVKAPVETRWALLRRVRGKPNIAIVPQTLCKGKDHLHQFHKKIHRGKGEGVMLREPGSHYEHRRSHTLLKVKTFDDEEAKIVGYTPGTGKYRGQLGAYEVVLLKGSRARFHVGTGISDAERRRPLPLGTIVTIQFQGKTNAGIPRFPALIGARDYE